MGCCVSTTNTKNGASKPHHFNNKQSSATKLNTCSRNPPPPPTHPLPEEETVVKEVLSETPSLPKPTISSFHENEPKKAMLLPRSALLQQEDDEQNDSVLKKPRMVFLPDELSEDASEICSAISESVSAGTDQKRDTNDELYDDVNDGVSKIRQRSPVKGQNRQVCCDRQVGKSPAKRSEPSPGRVRFGPGKDANGLVGNGQRVSVMSSDRRSRSPATRMEGSGSRTGLGRCPSARRTGKSPGRVGSEISEKARKVVDGNGNVIGRENKLPPTSNESLENPLVSLECFIFL